MKRLNKKHLITAGVCVGILAVLLTVLLLFSCGTGETDEGALAAGRAELLYPAVETATNSGASTFASHRPAGYPEKVGDALAIMMSLHEKDASYLYHVAFRDSAAGDASTKVSIAQRLSDADGLYAGEWVEIAASDPRAQGWYYFLFTAEEIRTLANAGIECRFVGSGEDIPDDGDTFDLDQAWEAACRIAGDSFRAKKVQQ